MENPYHEKNSDKIDIIGYPIFENAAKEPDTESSEAFLKTRERQPDTSDLRTLSKISTTEGNYVNGKDLFVKMFDLSNIILIFMRRLTSSHKKGYRIQMY